MNTNTNTQIQNPVVETPAANDKLSALDIIFISRYFIPAISTVGVILAVALSHVNAVLLLALIMVAIGAATALTVCPIKLLTFPLKCIAAGFKFCRGFIPVYGVADLCAAIFGTVIGAFFGLAVIFGLPAVFTIKKFFAKEC